ncbi:SRPBCC family protein [Leptospira sarikeiensis]|uniref:SRPBCC domain-containing protein n=1 Tax=Leptospira sarikeiensis TaxID=2484943 RepID=A0A4R9K0S7_9LEPT|nr:SRPBCC domain-containing protein [Leptospira sarikeiensis]TGL59253.1 SRPBCC domain-containing protein [Leptospira sarikeiensis]
MFLQRLFFQSIVLGFFLLMIGCATSKQMEVSASAEVDEKDVFIISHSFEADPKTLFEMWTNSDRFSKWLGPKGAKMYFLSVGVREEGSSQWTMTTSDGQTKYGKLHYKKISPNDLLVYAQNFCDKDGKLIKLPMAPTYPDTLLTTVTFTEEGPKKTKVTVRWEIYGEAADAERQTFNGLKSVMKIGWGESFEKLASILKSKK